MGYSLVINILCDVDIYKFVHVNDFFKIINYFSYNLISLKQVTIAVSF